MTWKEFKDIVESKGVKDEDEIYYIDVQEVQKENVWCNKTKDGEWIIS